MHASRCFFGAGSLGVLALVCVHGCAGAEEPADPAVEAGTSSSSGDMRASSSGAAAASSSGSPASSSSGALSSSGSTSSSGGGLSSSSSSSGDAGAEDAGPSSSSGGSSSSSGGEPLVCPRPLPDSAITAHFPPPAVAVKGSCSTAELDAYALSEGAPGATWLTRYASVTGSCRACLFTDLGDGNVAPASMALIGIVTSGPNAGKAEVNQGWCAGNVSGDAACGQKWGNYSECGNVLCEGCGGFDAITGQPDAIRKACSDTSYAPGAGRCPALGDAASVQCGNSIVGIVQSCGYYQDAWRIREAALRCAP